MLRLAGDLRATAVAEGVERPEQVEALRALGCALAQGHHFARAETPAAIARLLELGELGELTA